MKKGRLSYGSIIAIAGALLIAAVIISAALGRYPITIKEIFEILGQRLSGTASAEMTTQESLLIFHRLPRILIACTVGCALSAAGSTYQCVFQNPMAAPDILGASSGAAFGAALAILLGSGKILTIAFAFAASLITVIFVIFCGSRAKGKRVLGLILSGIVISSLVASGTSFIKLIADPYDQLPSITYWLMGSLNGAGAEDILFSLIPTLIGTVPLILLSWRMNILTLGDEEAASMGVNPKRLRTTAIVCAALLTASSVAVSGMIGWVGLVIPHIARRFTGNNFKRLLPASMLFGALFLLITDDLSRLLFASEIPIGILTSVIGAPFFIYLMSKDFRRI